MGLVSRRHKFVSFHFCFLCIKLTRSSTIVICICATECLCFLVLEPRRRNFFGQMENSKTPLFNAAHFFHRWWNCMGETSNDSIFLRKRNLSFGPLHCLIFFICDHFRGFKGEVELDLLDIY